MRACETDLVADFMCNLGMSEAQATEGKSGLSPNLALVIAEPLNEDSGTAPLAEHAQLSNGREPGPF